MPDARPGFFRRAFDFVDRMRRVFVNVLFLLLLLFVLVLVFAPGGATSIQDDTALVLPLKGTLVEHRSPTATLSALFDGGVGEETVLHEVIEAIDSAAKDSRIKAIVLQLDALDGGDIPKLNAVGSALLRFRATGKQVWAQGDSYTQDQYYLASFANRILMNPMGDVSFSGFKAYDLFMHEALEKLSINVNVFRVGQFKAAVEPFLRDDMSDAARAANTTLINGQWQQFRNRVAHNRKLRVSDVEAYLQRYAQLVQGRAGDMARVAIEQHMVDELLTRDAARAKLMETIGKSSDDKDFRQIKLHDYLHTVRASDDASSDAQVAVVTVSGTIVQDDPQGGNAGANQIVKLLREVRDDHEVKALVLRVDSPGGSAFASELIRAEVELTQLAGKPVVVSMSGLAASGGYWISSTADEIWADASTITGSIGVFGIVPTFERTLERVGVRADGVATAPIGSGAGMFSAIPVDVATVVQESVGYTYRQFINLVARGRHMQPARVEAIAQGRVWTGADAKRIGLVDQLGGIENAIKAAARRAKLKTYSVKRVEPTPNARQAMLLALADEFGLTSSLSARRSGPVGELLSQIIDSTQLLARLDDPRSLYALCSGCSVRSGRFPGR